MSDLILKDHEGQDLDILDAGEAALTVVTTFRGYW